MKTKNILTILVVLILLLPSIIAIPDVKILIDPVFEEGDSIAFKYRLFSNVDETINLVVGVLCSEAPPAPLNLEVVELKVNVVFVGSYDFGLVDSKTEPQNCSATISILDPYIYEKKQEFRIETNPSFEASIKSTKIQNTQESNVYILGEKIALDLETNIKGVASVAVLTYPNGRFEKITLPKTILASQEGTYKLEIIASKVDYKSKSLVETFSVIANSPVVLREDKVAIKQAREEVRRAQIRTLESSNVVKVVSYSNNIGGQSVRTSFDNFTNSSFILGFVGFIVFLFVMSFVAYRARDK
jgi:hypothetical protein